MKRLITPEYSEIDNILTPPPPSFWSFAIKSDGMYIKNSNSNEYKIMTQLLPPSGVTPGNYSISITVNSKGIITSAL